MGAMVGFAAAPCSGNCQATVQLPPVFSLIGQLSAIAVGNIQMGKLAVDSAAQAFRVLLPSSRPDFPAFFPAVIKRMSHSSMQLFLLECEGLSVQTIFNRRLKFTLRNQWGTGLNH